MAHNPHVSTREIVRDSGLSLTSVWRILKRHKYHPYHVSLHEDLHGADFQNRVTFCQWAREQIQQNPNFFVALCSLTNRLLQTMERLIGTTCIIGVLQIRTGFVKLNISVRGLSTCGVE